MLILFHSLRSFGFMLEWINLMLRAFVPGYVTSTLPSMSAALLVTSCAYDGSHTLFHMPHLLVSGVGIGRRPAIA